MEEVKCSKCHQNVTHFYTLTYPNMIHYICRNCYKKIFGYEDVVDILVEKDFLNKVYYHLNEMFNNWGQYDSDECEEVIEELKRILEKKST